VIFWCALVRLCLLNFCLLVGWVRVVVRGRPPLPTTLPVTPITHRMIVFGCLNVRRASLGGRGYAEPSGMSMGRPRWTEW
jgi:hypothetical protein